MKSSLLKKLGKVSDYFFGIGDNEYYKDMNYFIRTFEQRDIAKYRFRDLNMHRFVDVFCKNAFNLIEGMGIYYSLKSNDNTILYFIPIFEVFRNVLHGIKKKNIEIITEEQKRIIKSELTFQTPEEIKEQYDYRKEKELYNSQD